MEDDETVGGRCLRMMHQKLGVPTNEEASTSKNGLTPDWIIEEAVFNVMRLPLPKPGATSIKGLCDPCTNNKARPNIPAELMFDKSDNGLLTKNKWDGYCILLNPEYKNGVQWRFVNRAVDEVENGRCPIIILLCRNSTDTAYYRRLLPFPRVLLQRSSVQFKDYDSSPVGWGTALFCLVGPACAEDRQAVHRRFYESFASHGEASIPIDMELVRSPVFPQLLERLRHVANETEREFWVQCSACGVWRIVPVSVMAEAEGDDEWTCSKLPDNIKGCALKTSNHEHRGNLWQLYAPQDIEKQMADEMEKAHGTKEEQYVEDIKTARPVFASAGVMMAMHTEMQSGEHADTCGCGQCRFLRAATAAKKSAKRAALQHKRALEKAAAAAVAAEGKKEEFTLDAGDADIDVNDEVTPADGAGTSGEMNGGESHKPNAKQRVHRRSCACLQCQFSREAAASRGMPARLCTRIESVRAAQMAVNRIALRLHMTNGLSLDDSRNFLGPLARQWQDQQAFTTAQFEHAEAQLKLDKTRLSLRERVDAAKAELAAAEQAQTAEVSKLESALELSSAEVERAREAVHRGEGMWSESHTRSQLASGGMGGPHAPKVADVAAWGAGKVVSRKRQRRSTTTSPPMEWSLSEKVLGKPSSHDECEAPPLPAENTGD